MKWILIAVAALAALAAIVAITGWSLPVAHVATQRATVAAPPDRVWTIITDVEAFPSWRTDVKTVERVAGTDALTWIEHGRTGALKLKVEASDPPRRLVMRIADPSLPFGGTWTYELAPSAGGTTVTVTENGEIYNPVFRTMARFVFGYEATMASYLDALRKKVG
jgi:uncharacterized protein YndB with AHSA1/START domain